MRLASVYRAAMHLRNGGIHLGWEELFGAIWSVGVWCQLLSSEKLRKYGLDDLNKCNLRKAFCTSATTVFIN